MINKYIYIFKHYLHYFLFSLFALFAVWFPANILQMVWLIANSCLSANTAKNIYINLLFFTNRIETEGVNRITQATRGIVLKSLYVTSQNQRETIS